MNPYTLPASASLGGREYPHRTDFREMLKLMTVLEDASQSPMLRWYTALEYFYLEEIPQPLTAAAMAYLSEFLTCGQPGRPGPKLLDWQLDAPAIMADVNAAAGRELRSETHVHWWTFLSFFHSIRQGQLSIRVTIRDKLRRGQKLEAWEQEFYREHRQEIRMSAPETAADTAEKQRLQGLLE